MSGNADQRTFWDAEAGPIWVEERNAMDALFAPVLDGTLVRAELQASQSVLDIGCGAGTSTLVIADAVGVSGHVTGIDISHTLLAAARTRAIGLSNVGFLEADAQSHPFVAQSADAVVSRFGVMFFDDSVAAFRNMASALRDGGIMSVSVWGAISENPFFTLPAQIARQILGPVPKSDPDGPGPFALRDPSKLTAMMQSAGLTPQIDVIEETLLFEGTARDLAQTLCRIGPAHSALTHHAPDEALRGILVDALEDALTAHQSEAGIALPAQINYVRARKHT